MQPAFSALSPLMLCCTGTRSCQGQAASRPLEGAAHQVPQHGVGVGGGGAAGSRQPDLRPPRLCAQPHVSSCSSPCEPRVGCRNVLVSQQERQAPSGPRGYLLNPMRGFACTSRSSQCERPEAMSHASCRCPADRSLQVQLPRRSRASSCQLVEGESMRGMCQAWLAHLVAWLRCLWHVTPAGIPCTMGGLRQASNVFKVHPFKPHMPRALRRRRGLPLSGMCWRKSETGAHNKSQMCVKLSKTAGQQGSTANRGPDRPSNIVVCSAGACRRRT